MREEAAALRGELERSRHAQHRAEAKAKKSSALRDKYKQQIVRMGHDLGALQQALQTQLNVLLNQQLDRQQPAGAAPAVAAAAASGARSSRGGSDEMRKIQDLRCAFCTRANAYACALINSVCQSFTHALAKMNYCSSRESAGARTHARPDLLINRF